MDQNKPAIRALDLTKRFGDFVAVDGISFEVQRGEIFGFLGPNGSGKTTTIRMALGLMKPTSGSVEVLGMQVDGSSRRILPRIGYMSQRFSLYNDLTVLQNLQFYGAAYGLANQELKDRIQEAVMAAGLEDRQQARTKDLSGGWRQRLALGAAILHKPEVMFLDEPTAGVDPVSRRAFWDLLYRLTAQAVTVFVTTHYMDEAEHCHRLAFLQHGKIIARGSPHEIKSQLMHGQVVEIECGDAVRTVKLLRQARLSGEISLENIELYGTLVHAVAPDVIQSISTIQRYLQEADIVCQRIQVIEPSLEDVFISCMQA